MSNVVKFPIWDIPMQYARSPLKIKYLYFIRTMDKVQKTISSQKIFFTNLNYACEVHYITEKKIAFSLIRQHKLCS
jgi:hypothetical protein